MGDHDGLFKLGFGDPLHAAGELRSVLPFAILDAVALDQLERVPGSFVDDDLAQRHTDLLFRAPRRDTGEPLYLYFLMEHQSEPDRWMSLRVLGYVLRIWETLLRTDAPHHLPPIVPLVVHHGERGWTVPRSLHELVHGLDKLPALRPLVPDLHILVDELGATTSAELQARPLAPFQQLVLWFLRDVRRPDRFVAGLGAWDAVVRAMEGVDDSLYLSALQYLRAVAGRELFDAFRRHVIDLAPTQENLMITAAQFDFERGRERGVQEGLQTGMEKGIEKGREEGREEGLRLSLSTLLAQRFGPLDEAAQAWIARAMAPRLERALARLLTAPTIATILADE